MLGHPNMTINKFTHYTSIIDDAEERYESRVYTRF